MKESFIDEICDKLANGTLSEEQALMLLEQETGNTSQNIPPQQSNIYRETFKYDDLILRDHLIFDQQVLLGVVHCSIVIQAFKKVYPMYKLTGIQQFSFFEPIIFDKSDVIDIEVIIDQQDKNYIFEIKYINQISKLSGLVAKGVYVIDKTFNSKPINIAEFSTNTHNRITSEHLYKPTKSIVHLKSLHTVKQLWPSTQGNLAELTISNEIKQATLNYFLHPALLDGACVCAFSGNPKLAHDSFVPYFIKEISLSDYALPDQNYCATQIIKITNDMVIADMQFCDSHGRVLAKIQGFTFKKIDILNFFKNKPLNIANNSVEAINIPVIAQREDGQKLDNIQKLVKDYLVGKFANLLTVAPSQISTTLNFIELGLDSMQLIALSREIETEINIELYPTLFFEYVSVDDLCGYFVGQHHDQFVNYFKNTNPEINRKVVSESMPHIEPTIVNSSGEINKEVLKQTLSQSDNNIAQVNVNHYSDDIAVIGMAGLFPQTDNLNEFADNIFNGLDMVEEVPLTRWDNKLWFDEKGGLNNKIYCKWGGFVRDVDKFDAAFFNISEEEAKGMDPQVRLLLQTLYATADDAGITNSIRGTNTGIYVGSSFQDYVNNMVDDAILPSLYCITGNADTMVANRASFYFNLSGPSIQLDVSCSSTLVALHLACQALRSGECDTAFVAGVNLILSPRHYQMFCLLNVLSASGRCHSFDEAADGYVPAEAVAAVLLKPLKQAIADGDQIHAVIKGSAIRHGGLSSSITAPNAERQAELMIQAWKNARINPKTISYIEAHATGTKLGDPIEIQALKKAFTQYTDGQKFCAIGSLKAHMGHAEACAGVASLIKVILSMKAQKIPTMPNFKKLNSFIDLTNSPLYINREIADWTGSAKEPRRAGINSFGFGGTYAHVVVEEWINDKAELMPQDTNMMQQLIVLSAKDDYALSRYIENLKNYLLKKLPVVTSDSEASILLRDIAYTLQIGRESMASRVAFIVNSLNDLLQKLQQFLRKEISNTNVFVGKKDQEKFNLVFSGRAGQVYLQTVLQEKDLAGLAQIWALGADIDWKLLYQQNRLPNKISLPSYPFAKNSYWYNKPVHYADGNANIAAISNSFNDFVKQSVDSAELTAANFINQPVTANFSDTVAKNGKPKKIGQKGIKQWLYKELNKLTNLTDAEIDADKPFDQFNLNSIDMIGLYSRLTQYLGWSIPPAVFQDARTINALVNYAIAAKNNESTNKIDKVNEAL